MKKRSFILVVFLLLIGMFFLAACQGEVGIAGEKGATGAPGDKGADGVVGDKGPTGAKGEAGDAGQDADDITLATSSEGIVWKNVSEEDRKAFYNEAKILANIHHPYCCEYAGKMRDPFRIVTRRYPTNLYTFVKHGSPDVNSRFRIAYQLTSALCYLHSIRLIHRDLKLENVFVDENGNVRLADFGLTMYAPDKVKDDGSPPGAVLFLAPEQLLGKPFDQSAEVYSLGLMLYEIFSGLSVFESIKDPKDLIIAQKQVPMLPITKDMYQTEAGSVKLPPKEIFDLM